MNLPDFYEFMRSINVDEMEKRINEEIPMQILQFQANDKKSIEAAALFFYKKTVESSARVSLLYLQAYHEWLQEQLKQ